MALDDRPELLTVTEAAQLLRISRSTAYAEARRYLLTGHGLPVIRVGRSLRAPREQLRRLIEGEVTDPAPDEAPEGSSRISCSERAPFSRSDTRQTELG